MTAADLVAALRPVTECLDALGVRYYVTGSLASSAHGIARASLDVDIVAELGPEHVQTLVRCLGAAYYVPFDHVLSAVEQRRSFNLIHLVTMFKVDIFVSRRRPFDSQAADRAYREAIDEGVDALRLPIATAEDTARPTPQPKHRGGVGRAVSKGRCHAW